MDTTSISSQSAVLAPVKRLIQIESILQKWFAHTLNDEFEFIEQGAIGADNGYQVRMVAGVMQLIEPVAVGKKPAQSVGKRLQHCIDIERFVARQGSFPNSKKDLLGQAIGRKTVSVIDATAGWAGDSLHFCSQGYQVSCIERSALLAGFLHEAMARLLLSQWAQQNNVNVPKIIAADALEYLSDLPTNEQADCVYLDPMFPEKRKKSALTKKNMQVLQHIIGKDLDQEQLFLAAYSAAQRRVVVKRPDHADSLGVINGIKPSQQLRGKLLRYDVYLKA